jgi:hypothetical protein
VRVDANRSAINALGVQTAAGFEETRKGFAEMRGKLTRPPPVSSTSSSALTSKIHRVEVGDMPSSVRDPWAGMVHS